MKKLFWIFCSIVFLQGWGWSQSVPGTLSPTKVSLEIDPATFVWGGYSAHLRIQPRGSEHWLVGAGVYGMNLPDFLVNLNSKNQSKGWEVRIDWAVGFFGEYHFEEVNNKWFVGTQLGVQQNSLQSDLEVGSSAYSNGLLMGFGGYTWQPFSIPFYLKAWAGIGYAPFLNGQTELGAMTYSVSPVTGFGTLHLGYTF